MPRSVEVEGSGTATPVKLKALSPWARLRLGETDRMISADQPSPPVPLDQYHWGGPLTVG